jgi:hypothetical protein
VAANPSSTLERQSAVLMSIGVESEILALFESGFRQVNIDIRMVRMRTAEDLSDTRFEGCIIRLDEWSSELLARMRASTLNTKALVYGIGSVARLPSVARFGINALLERGTEAEITDAILSSYLLLVGRMRRFLRLPLVIPVQIDGSGQTCVGFSTDVSGGGMTIESETPLPRAVYLHLVLPEANPLSLPAVVCWRSGQKTGVQFLESGDLDRVRQWMNDYLGILPEHSAPPLAAAGKPES